VDAVCCASTCQEMEACNLPRNLGECTQRTLGDPCDAASMCASGSCADGVCCDVACEGLCLSCNRRESPGTCGLADDNTDSRKQCSGQCTACFGGYCAPALPGSDPNASCVEGLACDREAQCKIAPGRACNPGDSCATGFCAGHTCARLLSESVVSEVMIPDAAHTRIMALASDVHGTPSMVIRQVIPGVGDFTGISTRNVYYMRNTPQGWGGLLLAQPDLCTLETFEHGSHRRAAIIPIGTTDVVFLIHGFEECAAHHPNDPLGLVAYWTGPSFAVQRVEKVLANTTAVTPLHLFHVEARHDGADRILITLGAQEGADPAITYPQLVMRYSVANHLADEPVRVFNNVNAWGPSEFMDGQVVSFFAPAPDVLKAVRVNDDGSTEELASMDFPAGCAPNALDPITTASARRADGVDEVRLAARCEDATDTVSVGGVMVGRNKQIITTFTQGGGFTTPHAFRLEPDLRYITLLRPVQVSAADTAFLTFDSRDGVVSMLQQGPGPQMYVRDSLAQPILYNEYVNSIFGAYSTAGPVLAWTLDRLHPDGVTAGSTGTLFSRILMVRLTH